MKELSLQAWWWLELCRAAARAVEANAVDPNAAGGFARWRSW
jgi:hypothetical protein